MSYFEIFVAGVVIFCVVLCIPVFGVDAAVSALVFGVSALIIYGAYKINRWWSWLNGYTLICAVTVAAMFFMEDGVIKPSVLGRWNSDAVIATSIGEWQLSYYRRGEKHPEWCPYILGGMPARGSLLVADHPIGRASSILNGYKQDWEGNNNPIEFNLRNWGIYTLKVATTPVGYALVCIIAVWCLIV